MSFVFVSGRPALDLAGTLKWRADGPEEQLARPADLRAWLRAAGLVDQPPPVDDDGLARARALREAVYRAVTARRDGRSIPRVDVESLNAAAGRVPLRPRLDTRGRVRRDGDLDAALSTLARDVLDLLGGPDADRLRRCGNPRCTRVYLDLSRSGNRRWCGMTECGNAAKVAAFRARRRG